MPVGSRRGLVAPQNTFLENVIRKTNQCETNCSFLVANAQVLDWPIVFASDGFSTTTGYKRTELLNRTCLCDFMQFESTNNETVQNMREALESRKTGGFEILLQPKTGPPMWFMIHVAPIKDDKDNTVLFLLIFRNVTDIKNIIPTDKDGIWMFNAFVTRIKKSREAQDGKGAVVRPVVPNWRSSESYKVFNLSPEYLPRYHHESPNTPAGIILHYSNFKKIWDWSIFALTFFTAIIVPFNEAFLERENGKAWLYVHSAVDLIFVVDIVLNFRTSFVGPGGEVISDYRLIRMNYVKCWFIIDLLSCLPYDLMNFLTSSKQGFADEGISSIFSSLKVTRLLRLGRVARKLDHYIEYGGAMLILLIFSFGLSGHWLACGWYVIGWNGLSSGNGTLAEHNWLAALGHTLNKEYFVYPNGTIAGGPSARECYTASLYFTMTSLTSVGFGNISANTEGEQIFCIIMLIFGALLYATIFGNVTTIIQQMYADTNRYHDMLNSVREFLKLYEIPEELRGRVMDYIVSSWSMSKGIDTKKVLDYCPKDMKADICVHLNKKVFNSHASFSLASDSCLRAIAVEFVTTHTAPGDVIIHKGEAVDCLSFVVAGSLEILHDEEVVAILSSGDSFGDAFWNDQLPGNSEFDVRALTYCDLHTVNYERLRSVLHLYPPFYNSFVNKMELTFDLRKRISYRLISDVMQEREEEERRRNEPDCADAYEDSYTLRVAADKFKSRIQLDGPRSSEDEQSFPRSPSGYSETVLSSRNAEGTIRGVKKLRPRKRTRVNATGGRSPLHPHEEEIDHPRTSRSNMNLSPSFDSGPTPAYVVMDTDSVNKSVAEFELLTQAEFQSVKEQMGRIEGQLSRIVNILEVQPGGIHRQSAINQNANDNNNRLRQSSVNERNLNVSITMPESSDSSTDPRTSLVRNADSASESVRRYWLSRIPPHTVNLRLPSFRRTDARFSRHLTGRDSDSD